MNSQSETKTFDFCRSRSEKKNTYKMLRVKCDSTKRAVSNAGITKMEAFVDVWC